MQEPSRTVSELLFAVVLGNLDLERVVLADGRCQAGQTLPPTAPNPHQQHVASGLSDHAHDPSDWGRGEGNALGEQIQAISKLWPRDQNL